MYNKPKHYLNIYTATQMYSTHARFKDTFNNKGEQIPKHGHGYRMQIFYAIISNIILRFFLLSEWIEAKVIS